MSVRGTNGTEAPRPRIRFIDVLRTRDFAVLYGAELQSLAGDQLARVALSVFVFTSTNSASITAVTYAATFLPAIVGGYALARIGDHLPRPLVMVGSDLLRAGCFAAMALPAVPIGAVIALLVLAVFIGPAFSASEVSYLAARMSPARFAVANALRMSSNQVAQVGGFAVGGVLVETLGARVALLVNAATFVLSATAIGFGLRAHHVDRAGRPIRTIAGSLNEHDSAGESDPAFAGLWRDVHLRSLVALTMLAGFFVVPEGLAIPYGASMHASTTQVGLLLASIALGGAVGAALLVRVSMRRRSGVAHWMAVACGLPLAVTALTDHLTLALLCWLASGLFAAYVVQVITVVVQQIPDARRAHLVGIVAALLLGSQGLGLLIFGAATHVMTPAEAIGTAGLIGSACAFGLVMGPLRHPTTAFSSGDGLRVRG